MKQRFDVNCLSEEAKRNCARLTQALAEFTEKTLENLTVIVLEDMLSNIRQRTTNVRETADKYTSTCPCSGRNSPQEKGVEYVKERNRPKKSHLKKRDDERVTPKYHEDYTSEGDDSAENGGLVCDEPEHRCELSARSVKGGRKKAASVPATFSKSLSWVTRSARHSYSNTGRSADRTSRYRGHRKLSDDKYNYREKTYDDSDNEEFVNRNHESKHGHRDDGWVTITKAKHNRESYRRKKKSPKKVMMHDDCRICDGIKRVSIDDINRKEYFAVKEKNTIPRHRERLHKASEEHVDEGIESERQRNDKNTSVLSVNADESGVARNEFDELQSYSDSSSI